jgi:hypothetical protein
LSTAQRCCAAAIATCLLLTAGAPLRAWEADVHYALTYWLATQAGFSHEDADQIARGDQSYDESEHTSAIPTVLWVVLSGDLGAARDLQLKHFPSDALLPSAPSRRAVVPNSPSARRAAEAALTAGDAANALVTLGEAFHPLQDSWSHQGVPDIPYNLQPNLIAAHPRARGGWKSHNADLTFLHADEAIEAAHETYAFLDRFLQRNTRYRRRTAPTWSAIEPTVRAFATARTSAEKIAWATTYMPERSQQVRLLTAQAGSRESKITALSPPMFAATEPAARLSLEDRTQLLRRSEAFFNAWLVKRDVEAALAFIDLKALSAQFADEERPMPPAAISEWAAKLLTLQLIDDHVAVNAAGHGDPGHPRYADLPQRPMAEGPFKATRTMIVPTFSGRDFVRTDVVSPAGYALVLANETATHDALTLVWRQTENRWAIVRVFSLAE